MDLLQEAGLLEAVEKQGFMHKCGAVFRRGNRTCNFDFSNQFTAGWKYTFQVPRADFDKTLADAVAARGVKILYGHGVTAVNFDEHGATVTLEQPDETSRESFRAIRAGLQRLRARAAAAVELEEPSQFPVREALFTHVTGDQRPSGREEGKIWACIHPGRRVDLDHPVFKREDQRRRGGRAGIFRRLSRRAGSNGCAPFYCRTQRGSATGGMQFVFAPQRIAATRAP